MKTADEMFEELGLVKKVILDDIYYFSKAGVLGFSVIFDTTYKHWYANGTIGMKLHLAIHQKLFELGWLDEL